MRHLLAIIFWSVIAAAFIGPGTVTTTAKAGAEFGYHLLWALTFSVIACLVLQEAAARLTICTGMNLGHALRRRFAHRWTGYLVMSTVVGAVIIGCAAYETGNVLGAMVGLELVWGPTGHVAHAFGIGLAAGILLWMGSPQWIARLLGLVVAFMGVAFLWTAWKVHPDPGSILAGMVWPRIPDGSEWLILGLIGTTVVPYNLFLGSGLAHGQSLRETRFGLTVAILIGGIISMGIVIVGRTVDPPLTFPGLARVLGTEIGPWAQHLFAWGLFAAGFSSAVTAPLAAAVTAQSLFADRFPGLRDTRGRGFRIVWAGVLLTGVAFGLAGVRPIPAIVMAQALNGILLPIVAVFLFIAVNDPRLMGTIHVNRPETNVVTGAVVLVTSLLGIVQFLRAAGTLFGVPALSGETTLLVAGAVSLGMGIPVVRTIRKSRQSTVSLNGATALYGAEPSSRSPRVPPSH